MSHTFVSWGTVLCEFEDTLDNRLPTFSDIGFKFPGDRISTKLKNQGTKVWTFPIVTLYVHTFPILSPRVTCVWELQEAVSNTCCSYTLQLGNVPMYSAECWQYCEYQHRAVISATLHLFYCCLISYIVCCTFRSGLQVDIVGFHTSKCVELKTVTGWCCRTAVCRIVLRTCSVAYPVTGHPDVGLP
jgi:hypothetical protein